VELGTAPTLRVGSQFIEIDPSPATASVRTAVESLREEGSAVRVMSVTLERAGIANEPSAIYRGLA
jgi:hypothetical protein